MATVNPNTCVTPCLIPHTCGGPPSSSTLLTGLEAWWTLDEASSTRTDSHTNGYNLTDTNSVGSTAMIQGNGATFVKASSQMLSAGSTNFVVDPEQDWAIAGWFQHEAAGGGSHFCFASSFSSSGIECFYNGNTQLICRYWKDAGGVQSSSVSNASLGGSLRLFVFQFTASTNTLDIDVDDGTFTGTSSGTAPKAINALAEFALGNNPATGNGYGDVYADEVACWQRLLTAAEITELYNSGAGITYTDL